jgi:glycosyltransferase involved in cell wall biosynthesis
MERSTSQPAKPGPLRVLFVAARYIPYVGGLETHVYEVGRRLAGAGVEVTVLTTDVSGALPTVEEFEGKHIRRVRAWPANRDYYFAPGIYSVITHGQWDIIHCQGYHNLVPPLAMLAALRVNVPYVLSFHSGGDVTPLRKALRRMHWEMLRPLLSHAKKLIAVSRFEADHFRDHLRLPAERFVVIPNGAYPSQEMKPVENMTGEPDSAPLILSVGRLERYKGHQRVIAAMPRVLEHIPDARLRIAGTGPYESDLREMTRKLGVERHVEIRAVAPEDRGGMAALLSQASLITLLSEYESQGIAVMEALALRRPVLVAHNSALREFDGLDLVYGVPLKSTPEQVASAMIRQMRQPILPQDIALPTWDDCASSLLALYQTIAGRTVCAS